MKDLLDILQAMAESKGRTRQPARALPRHVGARGEVRGGRLRGQDGRGGDPLPDHRRAHLRFVAPRKFADLGTIPVTKRDSIAVNILGRKAGEAMNNVPMVKHVAFFESVKLRDRVVPIQKMITVPILLGDDAIGVAQISRKGENPGEAGPDFTADRREEGAGDLPGGRPLPDGRPPGQVLAAGKGLGHRIPPAYSRPARMKPESSPRNERGPGAAGTAVMRNVVLLHRQVEPVPPPGERRRADRHVEREAGRPRHLRERAVASGRFLVGLLAVDEVPQRRHRRTLGDGEVARAALALGEPPVGAVRTGRSVAPSLSVAIGVRGAVAGFTAVSLGLVVEVTEPAVGRARRGLAAPSRSPEAPPHLSSPPPPPRPRRRCRRWLRIVGSDVVAASRQRVPVGAASAGAPAGGRQARPRSPGPAQPGK